MAWEDDGKQSSPTSIGHNQTYLLWCIKRYLQIFLHAPIWILTASVGCVTIAGIEYLILKTGPSSLNGLIPAVLIIGLPMAMLLELAIMELDVRYTFGIPLKGKDKPEGVKQ
jgi:hypothetical protein